MDPELLKVACYCYSFPSTAPRPKDFQRFTVRTARRAPALQGRHSSSKTTPRVCKCARTIGSMGVVKGDARGGIFPVKGMGSIGDPAELDGFVFCCEPPLTLPYLGLPNGGFLRILEPRWQVRECTTEHHFQCHPDTPSRVSSLGPPQSKSVAGVGLAQGPGPRAAEPDLVARLSGYMRGAAEKPPGCSGERGPSQLLKGRVSRLGSWQRASGFRAVKASWVMSCRIRGSVAKRKSKMPLAPLDPMFLGLLDIGLVFEGLCARCESASCHRTCSKLERVGE